MTAREHRRPLRRAALVVLTALAVLGVTPVGVDAQDRADAGDVVARIVARRHSDGRVEFALQQQTADGTWAQRQLPSRRFFPPTAAAGRWLVSSPLALPGAPGAAALPPALDRAPADGAPSGGGSPPEVPASPVDRFAAHLLQGANASRPASWGELVLDIGLSAVAREKAQAMLDTGTWQDGFDFVSRLEPGWDIWRIGHSVGADTALDHPELPTEIAAALLADGNDAQLACERCTHLGAGIATGDGRTFATVIVAGAIPGEELTEAAMLAAESEMADLVNELRSSLGLEPLEQHADIAAAARHWSQRMGAEEHFRHNFGLGDGYPPGYTLVAENIAAGRYRGDLSAALRLSFEDLVNSEGHFRNMTDPALTHHGYGIVLKAGWVWVTQNFATYP